MFDPYRKWLGILPKDQPPNHYRLLSLELFENDIDVIESAIDRTMGFIRQYQSGEHASDAAKLLNEIAKARICLLKPASKSEYDSKLRTEINGASGDDGAIPDIDWNSPELADAPIPQVSPKRKKKQKDDLTPLILISGGAIAVVGLLVVVLFLRPSGKTTSAVAVTEPNTVESKTVAQVPQPAATPAPPASDPKPKTTPEPETPTEPKEIVNLFKQGDMEFPAKQFSKTFPMVSSKAESILVARDDDYPHHGNSCLHFAGNAPWAAIRVLKLEIPPGKTICGKAWTRAVVGVGHFRVVARNGNGKVLEKRFDSEPSKEWAETSWKLAPELLTGATQLDVQLDASGEFDVYFDDISIWIE